MNNRFKVLVFKTNLQSDEEVAAVQPILDDHPDVLKWNVDRWDVDNVLRIEAAADSSSVSFIELIRKVGFNCDELPD